MANWIPIVGWGLTGFVFLLFPTGALPSPRWRPVAWAMVVVTGVFTTVSALVDGPLAGYPFIENPAGVLQVGVSTDAVKLTGTFAMALVGFAAVASLVVRARAATGDERQQVRWLEWSAMVVVGVIAAFATLRALGGRVQWAENWVMLVGALIPVSAGIAVLKYRLYGISVVIRKTVVFAVLAAFITAVYTTLVVGVGALLGAPDQPTPVLSIIATAVVAVAFDPVRVRARSLANRIVYGERVAPYEALSAFAQQMSGGIELDVALEEMARVIAGGVGARTVSVWLCYDGQLHPAGRWPGSAHDPPPPPVAVTGATHPVPTPSGRAFPVRHEGELLGAVVVDMGPADDLDPGGEQLVTDLAA